MFSEGDAEVERDAVEDKLWLVVAVIVWFCTCFGYPFVRGCIVCLGVRVRSGLWQCVCESVCVCVSVLK